MRIKLDENMPETLAFVLGGFGHDVDTVRAECGAGCDDEKVWAVAQEAARFLVTQDMDFSDLRKFVFGQHHGVMVVRLREPGRQALLERAKAVFAAEEVSSWAGCFVVVTDHKIRVRRPE